MAKPKIEKVETGIPGLDKILQGGIVKGNTVLISGMAGAGKTIFCSQFLWQGLQKGENCLFLTFEELPKDIKEEAKLFGWDFEKYEDKRNLFVKYSDPFKDKGEEFYWLRDEIERNNITRVALDSTSVLSLYYDDAYEIRRSLFKLVKTLKQTGATAILTTEAPNQGVSRYNVEEYVVDGVIALYLTGLGEKGYRSIQVRKMRKTDHSMKTHQFDITDKGLKIKESVI